ARSRSRRKPRPARSPAWRATRRWPCRARGGRRPSSQGARKEGLARPRRRHRRARRTTRQAEAPARSEEHTSELQSREKLVCRLLLEKKKKSDHRSAELESSQYIKCEAEDGRGEWP